MVSVDALFTKVKESEDIVTKTGILLIGSEN
jgi:hypothetical protein